VGASGLGDFIEQMSEIYSSYQNDWNKLRTAKMAFTGLPVGLICHNFYILLDRYYFEKTLVCMLKKIVLCQLVCSPLCIVTFYLTLGRLNNWSMKKTFKDIIEKGSKILLAEWMVW
jgi:protein Mpv17